MGNVKIELNKEEIRNLLKSQEVMNELNKHGDVLISKLPNGYEKNEYTGRNRVNVSVGAKTDEAIRDNLSNNTLLKAVESMRMT